MSSWLSNLVDTKSLSEKATSLASAAKEAALSAKDTASAHAKDAAVAAEKAAAVARTKAVAVTEGVKAEAVRLQEKAAAHSALELAHARLLKTCTDCLELAGLAPADDASADAVCAQLKVRWLQLVKASENFAAKGKAYKAEAKHQADRADKAIAAGRALQDRLRAALNRIQELESGVGVQDVLGDDVCLSPELAAVAQQQQPVASTPIFLHEAEFDLSQQLTVQPSPPPEKDSLLQVKLVAAAGGRSVRLRVVARPSTGDH